jgi:hypothetical protein
VTSASAAIRVGSSPVPASAGSAASGARFIASNGGGPGVRVVEQHPPQIIRRPTKLNPVTERLPFRVAWQNRKAYAFLPRAVLNELDRVKGRRTDAELVASFDKHRDVILAKVAAAIGAGRVGDDGHLHLETSDFTVESRAVRRR